MGSGSTEISQETEEVESQHSAFKAGIAGSAVMPKEATGNCLLVRADDKLRRLPSLLIARTRDAKTWASGNEVSRSSSHSLAVGLHVDANFS